MSQSMRAKNWMTRPNDHHTSLEEELTYLLCMLKLRFRDFSYFSSTLGIECLFIGSKGVQQLQELSCVYTFLVRYVLEHRHGEFVFS